MDTKTHLYLLWTTDNLITAENMVFMYATNAMIHGWWEKVTLILWGAATKVAGENATIQKLITEAMEAGVHVTACKACAKQLGVVDILEELHVEVKYWGVPLTEILKNDEKLITI